MRHEVAVLVGSLRAEGYSARLASALKRLGTPTLDFRPIGISALPLYDADREVDPPETWRTFRGEVSATDAVLFVTPEFNRSIPGALKNALDIGSRPYGENVFAAKPAAIASHSPGALGGFGANHALRQCLVSLNMLTMAQPEVYLGQSAVVLAPDGAILDDGARCLLEEFMTRFHAWITRQLVL